MEQSSFICVQFKAPSGGKVIGVRSSIASRQITRVSRPEYPETKNIQGSRKYEATASNSILYAILESRGGGSIHAKICSAKRDKGKSNDADVWMDGCEYGWSKS